MYQNLGGKIKSNRFIEIVVTSKPIKLATPEAVQMIDILKGFLNVMDFDRFLPD